MLKELLGDLYTPEIEAKLNGKELVLKSDQENMIPKYRFDEVNKDKKAAELKVTELIGKIESFGDTETEINDLKGKLSTITTEYNEYVEKSKKDKTNADKVTALKEYLGNENVLDPDLLIPFYNLDELSFDGGNLVGMNSITENLKTKFKSQFGVVKQKTPDVTMKYKDKLYKDLSLSERIDFKQNDPSGYEAARKAHLNK